MKKITIAGSFSFTNEQKQRLEGLGEVSWMPEATSAEEWLKNVQGADIIISDGSYLLDNLYNLENVFVTYPFIELGPFDSERLKAKGVTVANTQGSNRNSIVEWVTFMALALFRKFPTVLNVHDDVALEFTESLNGKKALIVGKGNIGTKVGSVLGSLGMSVDFFARGDDLLAKAKPTDLIVNSLNCNSTSKNLLDESFFAAVKPGAYFISFVRPFTYDVNGMIKALNESILAGAAIDCDPEAPGDTSNEFYQKVLNHEQILATPHIAFATEQAKANGAETVVKNVEAAAAGAAQNVLTKK